MAELVSIGVPVYRGAAFVAEALAAIRDQTHRNIDVLISVDGADHESAAVCDPFIRHDSRFRMVVQDQRLGWDGNINYLMAQSRGDFWYFHQQDDLVSTRYVDVLLAHALAHPQAAVVYSDLATIGRLRRTMHQNSILGGPLVREMTLMLHHFTAIAFHGLVRARALQIAGRVKSNHIESFAADVVWMASVLRAGELHCVPEVLYSKRYHDDNVHTKWAKWPVDKLKRAWQVHCRDMCLEAMQIDASVAERRLVWFATLTRLVSKSKNSPYLRVIGLNEAGLQEMLSGFLESFDKEARRSIRASIDWAWDEIVSNSYGMLDLVPLSHPGRRPENAA